MREKFQIPKSKIQTLKFVIFLFSFSALIINPSFVLALPTQIPSPIQERVRIQENIAVQERENRSTAEGKLEEKIQQIREAVREKVRERVQEVRQGVPRAYFGEIKQIGTEKFTLETRHKQIQVTVSIETKIIGKNKQSLEFKDLKVGDYCIAMGYLTETNVLEGKRIVIIPKPKPPVRITAFGRVTDISQEEKILTVKNEKGGLTYTVSINEKTVITKKIDTPIEKVDFSAIKIGDRVIVVGTRKENEEKIINAKIIHVIPGKALGKEKPTPTQKLSPSPTLEE
jgi:hypothetical protein